MLVPIDNSKYRESDLRPSHREFFRQAVRRPFRLTRRLRQAPLFPSAGARAKLGPGFRVFFATVAAQML